MEVKLRSESYMARSKHFSVYFKDLFYFPLSSREVLFHV